MGARRAAWLGTKTSGEFDSHHSDQITGSKSAADDLVWSQEAVGSSPTSLTKGGSMHRDLGILRWREGDNWLVACEKFDVLSQGSTLEEAWQRWTSTFALTALWQARRGKVVAPPPDDVLRRWILKDQMCTLNEDTSFN